MVVEHGGENGCESRFETGCNRVDKFVRGGLKIALRACQDRIFSNA